jgi:hypothetical protein
MLAPSGNADKASTIAMKVVRSALPVTRDGLDQSAAGAGRSPERLRFANIMKQGPPRRVP